MAEQITTVVDGFSTKCEVVRVISESKTRRDVPKGYKRVMAIIRCGISGKPQTRHVNVPR